MSAVCALHPHNVATGTCSRCGSFVCLACQRRAPAGLFCEACVPADVRLAERGTRFVANLVDSVGYIIPLFVLALFAEGVGAGWESVVALGMLGWLATFAAIQLYLAASGQSLGKRLTRIRVVRSDGSPAELWRIVLLRNVVLAAVGAFCGLVGIIDAMFIFGDRRRCLHDLIADTIVVEFPRATTASARSPHSREGSGAPREVELDITRDKDP